jgi:hypothetical protein
MRLSKEEKMSRSRSVAYHPTRQEVHIECPPGEPRPGGLIAKVIRGTGLPLREDVVEFRFFGHWKWEYHDIPREIWEAAVPVMFRRLKMLYKKKAIRAAHCGGF